MPRRVGGAEESSAASFVAETTTVGDSWRIRALFRSPPATGEARPASFSERCLAFLFFEPRDALSLDRPLEALLRRTRRTRLRDDGESADCPSPRSSRNRSRVRDGVPLLLDRLRSSPPCSVRLRLRGRSASSSAQSLAEYPRSLEWSSSMRSFPPRRFRRLPSPRRLFSLGRADTRSATGEGGAPSDESAAPLPGVAEIAGALSSRSTPVSAIKASISESEISPCAECGSQESNEKIS